MRFSSGCVQLGRLLALTVLMLTFDPAWAASQGPESRGDEPQEKKDVVPTGNRNSAGVTYQPASSPADNDYIIGTNDLLAINVWREPELSRTIPVRPDGKISLPLIDEIKARGLTPLILQARITDKLRTFLSNPEVTVIVQEVRSQKFNVVGAVLRSGTFPLAKPMTVLDAIATSGGFSEWAKTSKIYVLRRMPDGSRLRIPFNYKKVIRGKKMFQNVELEPGDTIVVP